MWLLGIFSIFLNIAGVICHDYDEVISRGFFYGYSSIVWLVIMLQASVFIQVPRLVHINLFF